MNKTFMMKIISYILSAATIVAITINFLFYKDIKELFQLSLAVYIELVLVVFSIASWVAYETFKNEDLLNKSEKNGSKEQTDECKDETVVFLVKNMIIGSVMAITDIKELNRYIKYDCEYGPTLVKISSHRSVRTVIGMRDYNDIYNCYVPVQNAFKYASVYRHGFIMNKDAPLGGNLFNKEQLIKAYNVLDKLVREAVELGAIDVDRSEFGIDMFTYTPEKGYPISSNGKCADLSIPVHLTTATIDEINNMNWQGTDWNGVEENDTIHFNSVGEFDMYYSSIDGSNQGVSELLQTQKYLKDLIKTYKNIKKEAKEAFEVE